MAEQSTVLRNIIDGVVVYNRACDSCKRRKIKCDNQQPCFQCSPRGNKCEYTTQFSHSRKLAELKNQQKKNEPSKSVDEKLNNSDATSNSIDTSLDSKKSDNSEEITCSSKFPPLANPICQSSTGFKFCPNVTAAVVLFNDSFQHIMKSIMPNNTEEYNIEYSTLLWHRLFTTIVPDDLIKNSVVISLDTITQLMYHGAIFSIGATLNDKVDRANHFHRAAATILDLPMIVKGDHEPETTKKIILSLIYCMFYCMLNRNYSDILPLWQRASALILEHENIFEPDALEEIICWMVILQPGDSHNSILWISKLETIQNSNNKYEIRLFQSIARILAYLPRLSKVPLNHTQLLTQLWNYATEAENILLDAVGWTQYQFYGVLVYGLKAMVAINMPNNTEYEVDRCTQFVERFYLSITDLSERIWIQNQFGYLEFVFENLHHGNNETNVHELTIGQVESLIEMISNAEPLPTTELAIDANQSTNYDNTRPFYSPCPLKKTIQNK